MWYLHDVCSRFHAQCLLPAGSHYVSLDIRLRGFIVYYSLSDGYYVELASEVLCVAVLTFIQNVLQA